jgi:small subunit ribosomal protein S3Ae
MAVKKQWYDIFAPKMFGEKIVGETLTVDPKYLMGRTIGVSLMEVYKNTQKFYIRLLFQVDRIEGNKAYTKLVGHEVMRERVYRMVQRHGRRVDCIQDLVTKDGKKIRVKTVFMLVRRVGTSMKSDTRKFTSEYVAKVVSENNLEDLMKHILEGNIQEKIRRDCSKLYPVSVVEIRKTEIKD